jgi:chromosome segregation ATPase
VLPPLIGRPEEEAAAPEPPDEQPPALPPAPGRSANLENLEALIAESKEAFRQRDEALGHLASLQEQLEAARGDLEILGQLKRRAGELQKQLAAVLAERDQGAADLAKAQEEVEGLKPLPAQVEALTRKLESAEHARATVEHARNKIVQELTKTRERMAQIEKEARELAERLKNAETALRKNETALANAKETRDEYEYRLQAVKAVCAGDAPPPRKK